MNSMVITMSECKKFTTIKPLGSNVLVRYEPKTEQDYVLGDILLPDFSDSTYVKAKVIALGAGKLLESGEREGFEFAVGDLVFVNDLASNEIVLDDEVYHIIDCSEVVAVCLS